MYRQSKRIALLVAFTALLFGRDVAADTILVATLDGNDCSGVFGQGFSNCAIPTIYDPDNTPAIIKFNANGSVDDLNSELFPTISGTEFKFTEDSQGVGTWTYTPGAGDPLVSFLVAKGGSMFNLFSVDGNSGSWFTPLNPANERPFGLSHLTFYEGGAAVVPEPGTWLLLGSGLIAAARARRKRATAD